MNTRKVCRFGIWGKEILFVHSKRSFKFAQSRSLLLVIKWASFNLTTATVLHTFQRDPCSNAITKCAMIIKLRLQIPYLQTHSFHTGWNFDCLSETWLEEFWQDFCSASLVYSAGLHRWHRECYQGLGYETECRHFHYDRTQRYHYLPASFTWQWRRLLA